MNREERKPLPMEVSFQVRSHLTLVFKVSGSLQRGRAPLDKAIHTTKSQ